VTDLAIPDTAPDRAPAVPAEQPPMDRATALLEWANAARQAGLIATSLAGTSFVPASLRGKPADITAAILAGQELGLQPMATLRSMDVIQGTPALRAHAMRGLVQSRGHEIELVESTPDQCVMRGRRKGSDTWQTVTWTTERAGLLGLLGKSEWKKQQQTMLTARATGELCRLIASDVLYAMPYAAEELRTADDRDVDVVAQEPRITLAEITRAPAAPTTPAPVEADPWAAVEYPAAEDNDEQAAAWPATAQPGGAE
jgi:hypothetical protein